MDPRNPGYATKRRGVRRPRYRNGYVEEWCPDRKRYIYQHRLVMEGLLGRHLSSTEVVHHIDHDKENNAPTNLALYASRAAHVEEHVAEGTWGGKGQERPATQRQQLPCPVCGTPFKPKRRTTKAGEQADTKTCSRSCGQTRRQWSAREPMAAATAG